MPDDYYSLPLRFDLLMQEASVRRANALHISLDESIRQHIYLLITTPLQSTRFAPDYGCTVWDGDFSTINEARAVQWTDYIADSVADSIRQYEPRLERVEVLARLDRSGATDAHKRMELIVTGQIKKSNYRSFYFQRNILIAPFVAQRINRL